MEQSGCRAERATRRLVSHWTARAHERSSTLPILNIEECLYTLSGPQISAQPYGIFLKGLLLVLTRVHDGVSTLKLNILCRYWVKIVQTLQSLTEDDK